jgi:hypothetical protein
MEGVGPARRRERSNKRPRHRQSRPPHRWRKPGAATGRRQASRSSPQQRRPSRRCVWRQLELAGKAHFLAASSHARRGAPRAQALRRQNWACIPAGKWHPKVRGLTAPAAAKRALAAMDRCWINQSQGWVALSPTGGVRIRQSANGASISVCDIHPTRAGRGFAATDWVCVPAGKWHLKMRGLTAHARPSVALAAMDGCWINQSQGWVALSPTGDVRIRQSANAPRSGFAASIPRGLPEALRRQIGYAFPPASGT